MRRHDNVKRTVDRLAESGVVVQPPMEDEQLSDAMGRPRVESVYLLEKRASYIVVARLSPEFTAALVERWQAPAAPLVSTTMVQALRLVVEQTALALEDQLAVAEIPAVPTAEGACHRGGRDRNSGIGLPSGRRTREPRPWWRKSELPESRQLLLLRCRPQKRGCGNSRIPLALRLAARQAFRDGAGAGCGL